MGQSLNWWQHSGWAGVTHVIYQCLYIDADCCVVLGRPGSGMASVLEHPSTYLPVVKQMKEQQLVFGMCELVDPETLAARLQRLEGADTVLPSLARLVDKYGIEHLELDADLLRVVYEHYAMNQQTELFERRLLMLGARLWISFGSDRPIWPGLRAILGRVLDQIVESLILRSFGFVRFNRVNTSHGMYQSMTIHPESALRHFETRYDMLNQDWPSKLITMEMDTCGVEYLLNERSGVSGFRLAPLKYIAREKMFGRLDYEESYDAANNCCLLTFRKDRRVISYDNRAVRMAKINFVTERDLQGFVVGEPSNDLLLGHPDSLMASVRAALLPSN